MNSQMIKNEGPMAQNGPQISTWKVKMRHLGPWKGSWLTKLAPKVVSRMPQVAPRVQKGAQKDPKGFQKGSKIDQKRSKKRSKF